MKLSQVLEKYYVLAMSETVSYYLPNIPEDNIYISFFSEGLEYEQYFEDQEVQIQETSLGGFTVINEDGEVCQFTALDGVDLGKLNGKS